MKEKLAFIDHEYHKKTKSGDFLRKILSRQYKITNFWVKKDTKINERAFIYKNFFFFQIFPRFSFLNKTFKRNIMWAPMYDSPLHPIGYSKLLWDIIKFYGVKVVSFNQKISADAKKNQVKTLDLKYFKKTIISKKIRKKKSSKLKILFWYRGGIRLNEWINFFDLNKINKIIYFRTLDTPKEKSLSIVKLNKFEFITKPFIKNSDFLKIIDKIDVFVCSRKKEGIGMAQVEALARGKYLVGFNDGTMNEYIINKKIGFLFDHQSNKIINVNNVKKNLNFRINYNNRGYKIYSYKKREIVYFFKKKQNIDTNLSLLKKCSIYMRYNIYLFKRKFFQCINQAN